MIHEVAIETFHGPLDLLLHLVKRNEMDVRDISMARIAEQFFDHLQAIQTIDVEWAGDFLVMAATLMEIKSKLLLPQAETSSGPEPEDPRRELVKQLVEYRKTKEAAGHLEQLAEERQYHVPRILPDDEEGATSPRFRRVEMWDLVSAFGRLIRETQALQPMNLIADETPQASYRDYVRDFLRDRGTVPFRGLFTPPFTRARFIGIFLAVLELIKLLEVDLEQPEEFGEIWLVQRLGMNRMDS